MGRRHTVILLGLAMLSFLPQQGEAASYNDNYIGIDFGPSRFTSQIETTSDEVSLDKTDFSTKFILGRNFSREMGLELFFVDFGELKLEGSAGQFFLQNGDDYFLQPGALLAVSSEAYGVNGVFRLELHPSLDAYIKLGYAFWTTELRVANLSPAPPLSLSNEDSDLFSAFGLLYRLGSLELGLNLETYQMDDELLDQISRVSLNAAYGFSF